MGDIFIILKKLLSKEKRHGEIFYYFLEISKGKKPHVPRWLSLKNIVIVTFAVLKR